MVFSWAEFMAEEPVKRKARRACPAPASEPSYASASVVALSVFEAGLSPPLLSAKTR